MRAALLLVTLALTLPLAAGVDAASGVRTTWRAEDAAAIARALLDDPEVRGYAEARAPFVLRVDVIGGDDAALRDDGSPAPLHEATYTAQLTRDAALAALNAAEPRAALLCLFASSALTLDAPAAHERLALRAAKARVASGCAPPVDAREVAPGVHRLGDMVFDDLGIPLGWQHPDAPRHLGRADAGIARLAPDAVPRAPVDLADPWRAPASAEMRALVAVAMDCPCEAAGALVPAGDWRAAVAADPRAAGAETRG